MHLSVALIIPGIQQGRSPGPATGGGAWEGLHRVPWQKCSGHQHMLMAKIQTGRCMRILACCDDGGFDFKADLSSTSICLALAQMVVW